MDENVAGLAGTDRLLMVLVISIYWLIYVQPACWVFHQNKSVPPAKLIIVFCRRERLTASRTPVGWRKNKCLMFGLPCSFLGEQMQLSGKFILSVAPTWSFPNLTIRTQYISCNTLHIQKYCFTTLVNVHSTKSVTTLSLQQGADWEVYKENLCLVLAWLHKYNCDFRFLLM